MNVIGLKKIRVLKELNWNAKQNIPLKLFPNELLAHLEYLQRRFGPRRKQLLAARAERQTDFDLGGVPGYVEHSLARDPKWKVAKIPKDCQDRRVEITGPVNNAKMVINMLNPSTAGVRADMAMLDFEDSMCPTWENVTDGYLNVIGAARRDLRFSHGSKNYRLESENLAHMMVRVRGLHMTDNGVAREGRPVSASLLDLLVCAYHTAQIQLDQGLTPIFYIPKMEHFEEAKWWNEVLVEIESLINIPRGSLRATVLIETLPATFQIEEILYEMRERILGLNGGRWDKIFSDIKILKGHADRITTDRANIHMRQSWMDNYQRRIIKICHRRGAYALGGMSAFTPGKDFEVRQRQTEKVRQDKKREAEIGCDGCWVSHPYFIGVARGQFDRVNQLDILLEDFPERPKLLPEDIGAPTMQGVRTNLRVAIAYLAGWSQGVGCVALDGLMEDLATLEISRAQIWQWRHHSVKLVSGEIVDDEMLIQIFDEELAKIADEMNLPRRSKEYLLYQAARESAQDLFLSEQLIDFLTLDNEVSKEMDCHANY